MSEISKLKELSKRTGITVEQLEIIFTLENSEKIIDVLANGSSMWGDEGLNGHFWCEMPDGTIIDEWFDNYDQCRRVMKIKNKTLKYYPCKNPITTAVMIKKARTLVNDLGGDEINTLLYGKNVEKCCMYNAIANCHKHGGTLRFGSLGLDTDCGGITMWIFGNEDFNTFNDFVKQGDGTSWTTRNQQKAELYCLKLGADIGMFKTRK
jgi:putative hemolysin